MSEHDDKKEALWKEFQASLDIYKFSVDFIIKMAMFSSAITGGMISYYLANSEKSELYFSLILPFLINVGFLVISFLLENAAKELVDDHVEIETSLKLDNPFNMILLSYLITLFQFYYAAVSLGLIIIFIRAL